MLTPDENTPTPEQLLADEDASAILAGHKLTVLDMTDGTPHALNLQMRSHFLPRTGELLRIKATTYRVLGIFHKELPHSLRSLDPYVLVSRLDDASLEAAFDGASAAARLLDALSKHPSSPIGAN